METQLIAHFKNREICIDNKVYYHINGTVSVNFNREDFSFCCDYCKLTNIEPDIKDKAEAFIKQQFEAFVLADAIAAKTNDKVKFSYVNNEEDNICGKT